MSVRPCDFQILVPGDTPPPPPPVHPDPVVRARVIEAAVARQSRRFVFAQTRVTGEDVRVGFIVHGVEDPNGSVILIGKGKPYGWYHSIAAAYAHLPLTEQVYLTWLDPAHHTTTTTNDTADSASGSGNGVMW